MKASVLPAFALLCATCCMTAASAFSHGEKATVLIFTTTDCPIANAMLPELLKLQREFEPQGVAFTLIHVDPDTTVAKAHEHAKAYGIHLPSVLDPQHALVRQFQATRTPEAFLLAADGSTAYHGRINDLYHAPGQRRRAPSTNDLRDAITAVLSGKPVAKPHQPAVGCVIADFVR